jgi:hypothetical protein
MLATSSNCVPFPRLLASIAASRVDSKTKENRGFNHSKSRAFESVKLTCTRFSEDPLDCQNDNEVCHCKRLTGDGWWGLAETRSGLSRAHLSTRAEEWYLQARPGENHSGSRAIQDLVSHGDTESWRGGIARAKSPKFLARLATSLSSFSMATDRSVCVG